LKRNETTFAANKTAFAAGARLKARPQPHFLAYLEPREHVWWLQSASIVLPHWGDLTMLPKYLSWI